MDKPIRPRYGIKEDNEETARLEQASKLHRTSGGGNADEVIEMASSYSEIFQAPFTRAMPLHQTQDDETPTEELQGARGGETIQENDYGIKNETEDNDDDGDDDEDDNEEGNNSKDSSTDATGIRQKRPSSLHYDSSFPYELERMASNDGEMHHFIAGGEEQGSMSPSQSKTDSINRTPSTSMSGSMLTRHYLQTQQPQIDATVLSDIEIEAQYLAASVDNLIENLCNLLHSISSITADNVEVHKSAVNKLTDVMDGNIKCMYTIMAKTEEITKSMKPTEKLGQRIREIKRLVDMLDSVM